MFASATLASYAFTWFAFVFPIWKIFKTSTNKCLSIIYFFPPIMTLILLRLESNFQLFKNSTKML
jgi:hypothetical protein